MDYGLIILMSMLIFFLINAAPLAGAWLLAGKLAGNKTMRCSLAIFIFLLESCFVFSITGILGVLNLQGAIIGAVFTGIALILAAKAIKASPEKPEQTAVPEKISYAERIFEVALLLILLLTCMKSAYLPGTDTMLYHLYYPAMWIDAGRIFSIPMQGLPHEYFPICGETLYGWLMFCGVESPFVCILQISSVIMAMLAVAGLWKKFNIPSIYVKGGVLLTAANGIIIENASMCYTDTLTGALLLTGLVYLINGFFVKDQTPLASYAFAIAGAIAMGLCSAVKYSGLVLAPIITLLMLIYFAICDIRQKRFFARWKLYTVSVLSAVAAAGVFYLPNFLKTGNPFYPVKIPFLFSNGVEFERSTVKINELYSLFINNNPWSMSLFSALLFLLLPLTALAAAWLLRRKDKSYAKLLTAVTIILLAAEFIMLMVYPAATQARQIIPYLMTLSLLFAPVLYQFLPQLAENNKKAGFIAAAILFFCFFLASSKFYWKYAAIALAIILITLLLALCTGKKVRFRINIIIAAAIMFMLFLCWYIRWASTEILLKRQTHPAIAHGITKMRSEYKSYGKPLKIASSGTWFNYYMLLDMPGNQVHCVPVNAENTLSAHLVSDVKKLREPVEYAVWLERLQQGNFTHLVIQLDSHQDYPVNRELELKWALAHPENFKLFSNSKNVYFFAIKY